MRRACVTGGGTGIGRGIALALARRGCALALAGRRVAALEAVAAEIAAQGGQAAALEVDLALPSSIPPLIERARAALGGPLELLVCNAGVMPVGRFESTPPAQVQQSLQVNLLAPLLLVQAALPDLRATHGSLVLIASQSSLLPMPFAAAYSAAKAGLHAFGAALRSELTGSGVHLLVTYPPAAATEMTRPLAAAFAHQKHNERLFPLADPLQIGEQIVTALERRQAERHWLEPLTPLIWLNQLAPALARRILRTQLPALEAVYAAAAREMEQP